MHVRFYTWFLKLCKQTKSRWSCRSLFALARHSCLHRCFITVLEPEWPSTYYYMMSHTYRWNIILTTFATRQLYQDQVRNDLEVPPYVTAGSSEEWDTIRSHLPPLGCPLSLNRALSPNTNNHTPSCMPGVKIWLLANPSQPSLTFVKESRSSLRGKMIAVRWSRDKRSEIFKGAGSTASLSTKQDLIYQEINSTNALEKPSLRWWHSGHRGTMLPKWGGPRPWFYTQVVLFHASAFSFISESDKTRNR